MVDTRDWDWETGEKKMSLGSWKEDYQWVEEPYVSPDGEKVAKFLRLRGASFDADGTLVPVEIYGPPTPVEWKKTYDMAGACVVCYDVMGLETHDQYGDTNHRLRRQIWAIALAPDLSGGRQGAPDPFTQDPPTPGQ